MVISMTTKKKFAWSWSTLTGYETCPAQHYHLKVAKDIHEKPSATMQDGLRQHKALEVRVKHGTPLPSDMRQHEPLMQRVDQIPGQVTPEMQVALNADLEETTYFAKDVWLRSVLDLSIVKGAAARVIDYKTGKRKPESAQLKLFAAVMFAKYPQIEKVGTAFWWLKTKETDNEVFTRDDAPLIWREFEPRVQAMSDAYDSGYFPEKPSGLCRGWCPVKSCEYWEPKRN